jgi:transposase-like protein
MVEDYPRTLLELERRFASHEDCLTYLAGLRWPKGFICPCCGGDRAWRTARGLWMCGDCGRQTSATSGTIFHRSRLPLTLWFRAIWQVTSQKNGASAMTIQRLLGLGSYQTAWAWMHKLRRAMVRPERDRLRGRVEVDETFIGGEEPGFEGRSAPRKVLVAIAAEEDGKGIGRMRAMVIANAQQTTLHQFIQQTIEPASTVHTDG